MHIFFAGRPKFFDLLNAGRPNIANRERFLERTGQMLGLRCLSDNGLFVKEFEPSIAKFLNSRHCIPTIA
jgi:dTDP-4-amino-4,6-dideoxyglucose